MNEYSKYQEKATAEIEYVHSNGMLSGEIDALGMIVERLDKAISVLAEILDPVLRPSNPEPGDDARVLSAPSCQLAVRVRTRAEAMTELCLRLERIISRVAV